MVKRIITISRELEAADALSEKKSQRSLGLLTMIKISLMRLQRSRFVAGICSGKSRIISEKRLVCICIWRRDITGKSVENMVYEEQRKVILDLAGRTVCDHWKKCRLYSEG